MPAGRFAPSPSGRMHLGNMTSALLAWLSARHDRIEFKLRLEDLDGRCRREEAARLIIDDLRWAGLDFDGEPERQSAHLPRFEEAYARLRETGLLYPCYCSRADLHAASAPHAADGTPIYPGTCRNLGKSERVKRDEALRARTGHGPAWRIEVPAERVGFRDGHLGDVTQDLAREAGDFVVRRSDGVFAYQLAVVVDDAAAGVTQVVRGDDLVSSTPRQIWLQHLLGYSTPAYFHHPLLVDGHRRRLSKRDRDLEMGYVRDHLPGGAEALVGWLAYWAGLLEVPKPVVASELVDAFSWDAVGHKPRIVDPAELFAA